MPDDVKYEDADVYSPNMLKDRLTFRDILLAHLRKITQFASVEFIGGYWETKPSPVQNSNVTIEVYVPDTREVYSNAVECLADLLAPYFDKEMREAEAKCEEHIKQAYLTYSNEDDYPKGRGFKTITHRITYRDERLRANKKLFRELCKFLYRKKYLELGSIED